MPRSDRAVRGRHARWSLGRSKTAVLAVSLVTALLGGGIGVSGALAATTPSPTPSITASPAPTAKPTPRTWYVDCSSTTNGDGTSKATPWNSVAAINKHRWYAPGEQILLKKGTTCRGRITPSGSGTPTHHNLLGAYGTGTRPVVAGGGTRNGTGTVQLMNVSNWTVQDLHITNAASATTKYYRSALMLLNQGKGTLRMRNIIVQRLLIDHVSSNPASHKNDARAYGGISALTPGGLHDGFDNLQILHNTINGSPNPAKGVGRTGIVVKNRQYPKSGDTMVRIAYNTVRWARGDSIVLVGARSSSIDHNLSAYGAAFWPCPQCGNTITPATANAAIWTASSSKVSIERNEVYGEHLKGGDGEAIDLDRSATHAVVQYNYAHDNQGGGVLICAASNSHIRFNILQNNGRAAVVFTCHQQWARTVWIYNNTIFIKKGVTSDYVVKQHWNKATGIRFFNNLVYTTDKARYAWPTKPTSAANTFVGTHSATEPRGAGTSHSTPNLKSPGHGTAGMESLGGYHVRSTAKAQRGVAIPTSVKVDIFGHTVSTKHPIRGAASS